VLYELWIDLRSPSDSGFTQKAAELYKPAQSLESSQLMHELLTAPDAFATHLERYAASVIVGVTYGRRVLDIDNDYVVQENKRSMEVLTHVNIPGKVRGACTQSLS
jgi:hypothetical protein